MCTHNRFFEQKYEEKNIFSSEIYHFYSREILLYIALACLRNVLVFQIKCKATIIKC